MAEILGRLWPTDKVILAYFVLMCGIEAVWFNQIPEAWWLLALHAVAVAFIVIVVRGYGPEAGTLMRVLRHWYSLFFVACCYREMAIVIAGIRHARFDQALADLDYAFWHANPSVWLERTYFPALTEYLQIVYTLFVPVVLLVPFVVWRKRNYADFRYQAFLLSLGFLASYLGYLMVPARGPRYLLEHLQRAPLHGMWLFDSMQTTLNRLESDHYDCFPSGHTELTILACWLSRSVSRRMFWAYFLYTICIVFATVYLRYHYTVDLLAGVLVAVALIIAAPVLYRRLSVKGDSIGD